jgi:putative ABC transport system permease protein
MAIRSAVGAPRARLVRQLLVESLVLSVTAGVVGVIVADWALAALTTSLPFDMPRIHEARIDRTVLLFLTMVSIVTGIVFGMAPALQLSSASAGDALKDTAHAAAGGRSARTRQVLVIAEVALSLVLLATAGLLIRSLVSLQHVDAGFVPEHAVGAGMMLPESRYPDDESRIAFARRLVEAARGIPGVSAAAISTTLPLTGSTLDVGFDIEGQPQPPGSRRSAIYFAVSPDYFKAMGVRLLRGRAFTARDDERAPNVVIVGETMARRYWPAGDAIGKRLTIGYNNTGPREVVGVVADVKNESLSDPAGLTMYTPFPQTPWPMLGVVVRSDNNPAGTVRALTTTLSTFAPDLPADDVQVLSTFVARTTATPRFLTASVASFAGFALLLAGCGLFSVLAYSVAQRRREIGIRMALGAGAADVGRHIVGQAVRLGAIGLAVGLLGAIAAGQVLQQLLFNVSPSDPLTLAGVIATLAAIVLLAAYIPARRAIQIDPARVLRSE